MALADFGDTEPSCGRFPGQTGSYSQDPRNGGPEAVSKPCTPLLPELLL